MELSEPIERHKHKEVGRAIIVEVTVLNVSRDI